MSDSPATTANTPLPTKPYNFALGALASVLAIPAITIATIIVGQVGFEYPAIFSGIGMVFAFSFFGAASHRRVVRGVGFLVALVMGIIATTFAFIGGFISGIYYSFNAVGGKGGLLGEVFIGRVVFRLTDHFDEFIIQASAVVVLAIILLVKYIKDANAARRLDKATAGAGAAPNFGTATMPPTAPTSDALNVLGAPDLTSAAGERIADVAAPVTLNAPSSGILLNGQPVSDSQPKKKFWQ
ncbi:hypothetical protein I6E74_03455 [Salinibacterium sp. SWN139]|uniref:hypothetical protein n=1 Tax=Salinibacterium sp. SWN139 TaxID=2792055 RepID=UPI0018CEFA54|nr:hypothetical protein [Salinibacterium sp. SWN139]MBH0053223.1 hypothetical protein [Salinibacterium sp. SWN139]